MTWLEAGREAGMMGAEKGSVYNRQVWALPKGC